MSISVKVVGNICVEPELRYTPSGTCVINFTVADTDRVYDRTTNEWKDGDTVFMRCFAWKNAGAENIAESITKGARVIVTGKLKQRSFTTDDGNKRQVIELEVEEMGPSLKFAQATPVKAERAAAGAAAFWTTSDTPSVY